MKRAINIFSSIILGLIACLIVGGIGTIILTLIGDFFRVLLEPGKTIHRVVGAIVLGWGYFYFQYWFDRNFTVTLHDKKWDDDEQKWYELWFEKFNPF